MTPDHTTQHDQRIWPAGTPKSHDQRPSIATRITAPIRALAQSFAALTTPPGIVVTPDGITYRPLARTTLDKALAPAGPGHLDFAVTLPDPDRSTHRRIKVRATRDRHFHDLRPNDPFHARIARAAAAATRPGDRVLLLGAGTGALAAHIAEHVGPSGAVTAFEADAQSVAFARARYPLANTAHERLTPASLSAEPPAAAETIILTPTAPKLDPADLLSRLTTPGRLLLIGPHAPLAETLRDRPNTTIRIIPGDSEAILVSTTPNA